MFQAPKLLTKRSLCFGILLFVVAACVAWANLSRHTNWTPDGYVYARMMLQDTGASAAAARRMALQFYLSTPVGSSPRYRRFFTDESLGMFTADAKPFASRVLYPYLASLLYRTYGFQSLVLVSMVAYVLSAVGFYVFLLYFGRDWLAAVVSLAFFATPLMRTLGASALTDMLALLFWIWGLVVAMEWLRHPRFIWAILLSCCWIGLALTRPAPYLPLGLAFGAIVWSVRTRHYAVSVTPFTTAALAGICAYALSTSVTHTPGLGTHLHWLYQHALNGWLYANPRVLSIGDRNSFSVWYLHDVLWVSAKTLLILLRSVLPAVLIVVAIVGFWQRRDTLEATAIVWAGIFGILGVLANPVLWELPRLVEAPLYPLIAAGIVMLTMTFTANRLEWLPGSMANKPE